MYLGPILLTWINFNPTIISIYIHYKVWVKTTYPFLNFNGCTVEVEEWMSNSSHTLLGMLLFIYAWI